MAQKAQTLRIYSLKFSGACPTYLAYSVLVLYADFFTTIGLSKSIVLGTDRSKKAHIGTEPLKAMRLYQVVYHTVMQNMQTMTPAQPSLQEFNFAKV